MVRHTFLKKLCQYINANARINYFIFIIILNFLISMNFSADFYKFLKCCLFNEHSKNLQNIFVNNDRLQKLIIDQVYVFSKITVNLYFLHMLQTTNQLTEDFFLDIFGRRNQIIQKKPTLKTYSTKKFFLKVDFTIKLSDVTSYMSQINPKEFVHNTAYSVKLPYIAHHSL